LEIFLGEVGLGSPNKKKREEKKAGYIAMDSSIPGKREGAGTIGRTKRGGMKEMKSKPPLVMRGCHFSDQNNNSHLMGGGKRLTISGKLFVVSEGEEEGRRFKRT